MAYDLPFGGLCAFCGEPAGIILPARLEWTRLCGPCSRVVCDRSFCKTVSLALCQQPEKSQSEHISASPLEPPGGARPILSCAPGACYEVPREERGAWLRGAAPGSATSP
jgi:hypothetical protein